MPNNSKTVARVGGGGGGGDHTILKSNKMIFKILRKVAQSMQRNANVTYLKLYHVKYQRRAAILEC